MSAMPASVELGSPILVSGSVSSTQMMSALSMTYLWGDSQSNTDPFTYSPSVGTMPVANQHTYAATGSYTITVTANATYENGSTDTATLNFPVSILPPASPPPTSPPPPTVPPIASVRIETVRDTSEPPGVAPYEAVGQFNLMRFGGDVSQPLTVYYSAHGTATALLDYEALYGSVTFAAHATTATISLTALDDAIWESAETVTAVLSVGAGYTVLTPAGSDTISIVDNEQAPVGTGTGLFGRYYNTENLTDVKKARIDARVDFNWELGGPAFGVAADQFSARWTGKVEPRYSGNYTFYLTADDGVRLWVNGALLVPESQWDADPGERSGVTSLMAGQKYDIVVEYREKSVSSLVRLEWMHAQQAREVIPQSQLYPNVSTIGDFVWKDLNQNGAQDTGEPGVSGVTVSIKDTSGNLVVPAMTTLADGLYSFLVPADKTYKLHFAPGVSGDVFAPQDAAADGIDSDVGADGYTALFVAPPADGTDSTRDAGLQPIRFDLDVNANGSLDDAVDGAKAYLPGYSGGVAVLSTGKTYKDHVYVGQHMKLILEGVGTSNAAITRVDFEIFGVTVNAGYASNKTSSEVEGAGKDDDYSFAAAANSRTVSVARAQMGENKTMVDFYAKDYGGGANINAKVYVQDGAGSKLAATYALGVPLDTDGDTISNAWQNSMASRWQSQYGSASTPSGLQDLEMRDPDGAGPLVEQKDTGDAHTVLEEYRGYILDGGGYDGAGANGHPGGHIRLDPARKEVLLEVDRAETLEGLPPGGFSGMLQGAAKVFSHSQRGAGIYVYWVVDDNTLQINEANVNTFPALLLKLDTTRNLSLTSDFVHHLFVDKGMIQASAGQGDAPAFSIDNRYPLINRGAAYSTSEISSAFPANVFPKRDELFACVVAHEIAHQLMNAAGAIGYDDVEHTTNPHSDFAGSLNDLKCLMFVTSTIRNREFESVLFYPVVQVHLSVAGAEGIGG